MVPRPYQSATASSYAPAKGSPEGRVTQLPPISILEARTMAWEGRRLQGSF